MTNMKFLQFHMRLLGIILDIINNKFRLLNLNKSHYRQEEPFHIYPVIMLQKINRPVTICIQPNHLMNWLHFFFQSCWFSVIKKFHPQTNKITNISKRYAHNVRHKIAYKFFLLMEYPLKSSQTLVIILLPTEKKNVSVWEFLFLYFYGYFVVSLVSLMCGHLYLSDSRFFRCNVVLFVHASWDGKLYTHSFMVI